VQIVIHGHHLPGMWSRNVGVPIHNVHAGVQVGQDVEQLVRGDAASATWTVEVKVVAVGDAYDFRGPAVHGRKGERFLYIAWGDVGATGTFAMFRRAKLMLDDVDSSLIAKALAADKPLQARIHLTDDHGGPRCARVGSDALRWSV